MLDAIKVLESPDAKSRTPANEGRRIQKVQGGWLILNHGVYQSGFVPANPDNGAAPVNTKSESRTQTRREDKDKDVNTHVTETESEIRVSGDPNDPNRVSQVSGQVSHTVNLQVYKLSPEERRIYDNLDGKIKALFIILRDWASLHGSRGSSKFPVSRKCLVKKFECSGANVTLMLGKLVKLGAIRKVEEHDYRERKSATYRWTLPTTIPMPSDVATDEDEESVY
jgi:hypothetical protein